MKTTEFAPAAQYLRVSTDQQCCSLQCQRECIAQYASERGFAVIATYVDHAKSGLLLKNRLGLKQLLVDVTTGVAKYRTILVYDVSRWGRFQDPDEAGHYEFLCKSSGIPVRYCAEQFENNDTATASIMKSLKRTMAAEYSRELGNKVLAGQRRIARLGFRSGGAAPYGYRRILVSADRTLKQHLSSGDRKGIATDRVILFPSPKDEVACVQQIYRMFIDGKMSFCAIARRLNADAVPYVAGRSWTHHAVRAIVTSPTYAGTLRYGRSSRRLRTPEIKIPIAQQVLTPHAFESIVDDTTYMAAQDALQLRTNHKSNDQLLRELREVLRDNGRLTASLIRGVPSAASPSSYRQRFGSLGNAYKVVGYHMSVITNVETRIRVQGVCKRLMEDLRAQFPQNISIQGKGGRFRTWLRIIGGPKVVVRACMCFRTQLGNLRWRVRSDRLDKCFIRLLILMSSDNHEGDRLILLPRMGLPKTIDVSEKSRLLAIGRDILSNDGFLDAVREIGKSQSGEVDLRLGAKFLRSSAQAS